MCWNSHCGKCGCGCSGSGCCGFKDSIAVVLYICIVSVVRVSTERSVSAESAKVVIISIVFSEYPVKFMNFFLLNFVMSVLLFC